jgi:hypothetical protein
VPAPEANIYVRIWESHPFTQTAKGGPRAEGPKKGGYLFDICFFGSELLRLVNPTLCKKRKGWGTRLLVWTHAVNL